jgi:hypothetical protein
MRIIGVSDWPCLASRCALAAPRGAGCGRCAHDDERCDVHCAAGWSMSSGGTGLARATGGGLALALVDVEAADAAAAVAAGWAAIGPMQTGHSGLRVRRRIAAGRSGISFV